MILSFRESGKGEGETLFILHGLFGSGDNWLPVARKLPGFRCVLPDMRNHGESPRSEAFGYRDLAKDVLDLADSLGIRRFSLLGHSMGGKAAMTLSLLAPERVVRLVVGDIAPRRYEGGELLALLDILRGLDLTSLRSRREADRALERVVPQAFTRGFLLKSLEEKDGVLGWKLNLEVLRDSFPALSDWEEKGRSFEGPVLFLKGENSPYIGEGDILSIRSFFPRAETRVVPGAGHMLHTDNQEYVLQSLEEFLHAPT